MKKIFTLLAILCLAALGAKAQNGFRGAYFMDTYLYGHTMNPALTANRSYASVALGRIDIQTQSNLGASTVLYPTGNGLTTFLSEGVSSETFLSKIRKHNMENVNAQVDLINFGFWTAKNQFHSFSLNLHVYENIAAPYDIFRFLKNGSTDGQDYDLSGLGARARGYAEAAYGISFPVTDQLRIGGKVKALVGLVYTDMRFDRFDVTLSGDRWSVATDGQLRSSNIPLAQTSESMRISEIFALDDFDIQKYRPSGFGGAVDLGVTWDVLPWLQLSASMTDLGFIRWKIDAPMGTKGSWEYTGFDRISFDGNDNLQEQLDAKMVLCRSSGHGAARGQVLLGGGPGGDQPGAYPLVRLVTEWRVWHFRPEILVAAQSATGSLRLVCRRRDGFTLFREQRPAREAFDQQLHQRGCLCHSA